MVGVGYRAVPASEMVTGRRAAFSIRFKAARPEGTLAFQDSKKAKQDCIFLYTEKLNTLLSFGKLLHRAC